MSQEIEITKTTFVIHYWIEEQKLLKQIWTNANVSMDTKEFKQEMLEYLTLYDKYDIKFVLVDSREMNYPVVPEIQDWANENIIAKIITRLKKIAFIMPKDIFEQISIQQAMEDSQENDSNEMLTNYFDDDAKAMEWLLG